MKKGNKKKRQYNILDVKKFIRAWQSSKTCDEAHKKYGKLTINQFRSQASNLRHKGVPLKRFGERHDYAALAKLARQALGGLKGRPSVRSAVRKLAREAAK